MTRSKIELAIILAKLRGKDEDPVALANEMSLMKLCYEIQKVEEEREASASAPEATQEQTVTASASKDEETPKEPEPLTKKEEEIVEELKVPEKTTKEKRNKHILSWLLDSSSDED